MSFNKNQKVFGSKGTKPGLAFPSSAFPIRAVDSSDNKTDRNKDRRALEQINDNLDMKPFGREETKKRPCDNSNTNGDRKSRNFGPKLHEVVTRSTVEDIFRLKQELDNFRENAAYSGMTFKVKQGDFSSQWLQNLGFSEYDNKFDNSNYGELWELVNAKVSNFGFFCNRVQWCVI